MGSFMKKVCATVVALAMVFVILPISQISTVFAISLYWDGTADATWASGYTDNADTTAETFTIITAEQLAQLAVKVNSGLSFTGKTINLTADIVLNDTSNVATWGTTPPTNSWTAIGLNAIPFSGTFEGNSHTVSGIYINKTGTTTPDGWQGLFGLSNGTIKNVGVIDSYIKGYYNTGGVVGQNAFGGTVTNCYNQGTIIGTRGTGGVVGWSFKGQITDCHNTGAVTGTDIYVGGLVGVNEGSTITNCYNIGAVSGTSYVGGAVGYNDGGGTVTTCHNAGVISATGAGAGAGGVVGYSDNGGINTCYNTGAVSGAQQVGGVLGAGWNNSIINNSYNTGTVNGSINAIGGVTGTIGTSTTITNCSNTGAVTGTGTSQYIGGVAGYSDASTLQNSYNTGAVNGPDKVGGVSGYQSNTTTNNCYNTGTISGATDVGGVAGKNYGANPTITNCYYYGYNVGVGGTGASQTGTTPFVKITDNPLGTNKTTTITEQTTTAIRAAWSGSLGSDFTVAYSGDYTSSDTSKATVSGTTITGISAGNSTISGRTLTIYQNGLANGGFIDTAQEIVVPISMPLAVTTNGGGQGLAPTVTTQAVTTITTTTATANGNITDLGSPNPTAYGVCWNTTGSPTTSDNKTNKGGASVTGAFTSEITGLTPNTTYYVRAYATNSAGTSYGSVVTFTTSAPTISVAFDSFGGSPVSYITNIASGSTISKPTDPTKYGYTFDGWYKEVGLTNAWDFANDTVTANITLYAKWTPTLPTITIPNNITLVAGEKLSGITVKDAGYIYFVKSGQTATSYGDLMNLHNNDLAEQRNYMSIDPTDKIDVSFLDLGVYDIYVVNVANFLIAKSDKTLTIKTPYTKGTGTEKDPYWVTNALQFRAMQAFQNTSFILKNDISLAHIPNWEPIYFAYNKLDGNYHNITGLNVDTSGSSKESAGLFSMVYFSEVKHLGIINANVKGVFAAGILAGNVYDSHIEEVYTTGTVEGVRCVGGLIGMYTLAIATVENCYSTATVKGEDYVGGLVGGMEESSIIHSYSAGQVIVQDSSSSSGFGGFLGADNPTGKVEKANIFVANYYDKQTSGQSDSIGATGKTTAEMKTKSTFLAGSGEQVWDFTNVWAISPTYNNGYPYLKGFYTAPTKPVSPIPSTPDDPKTIVVVEAPAGINNADKITVEPIGEAFDESVEVRIKNDADVKKLIEDFIKSDGKINLENANVFPLDISLYLKGTDTKVQPNNGTSVKITCPIPESLLAEKDNIKVVCVIDGKLIVLETKVILIDGVWCVQFTANHFSPYAIVVDKDNALSNEKTSENAENTPTPNPVTGENTVLPISLFAILSVATLGVVIKKRKFKVVKRA